MLPETKEDWPVGEENMDSHPYPATNHPRAPGPASILSHGHSVLKCLCYCSTLSPISIESLDIFLSLFSFLSLLRGWSYKVEASWQTIRALCKYKTRGSRVPGLVSAV